MLVCKTNNKMCFCLLEKAAISSTYGILVSHDPLDIVTLSILQACKKHWISTAFWGCCNSKNVIHKIPNILNCTENQWWKVT